ncbi:hypothetical protein AHAS_Ahas12G0143500 [Arachis hypogaea]
MQDKKFVEELNKERGVPSIQDWDYAKSVLSFLEMFYDATLCIVGSSYVTSNLYMKEVFALGRRISQYCDDDDLSISLMKKVGDELKTKLSSCLHSLYNLYQGADEGNQDDTLSQPSASDKAKDIYDMGLYRRSTEAIVCTEGWLKEDFFSSLAPENFEELEKVEQDSILSEDITCSVGSDSIALEND